MTNSLCPSWKIASFTISLTFSWYPFVKNSIALAYRSGVPSSPSRSGSSPTHSRIVRTAPANFWSLAWACSGDSSFLSLVPKPAQHQQSPGKMFVCERRRRYVLGLLNPSKSITGLGDLVPAISFCGLTGLASSRGSLAGLLTLCLLFECDPLTFPPFSDFCFLFLFLLCPSSVPPPRDDDPLGTSWSEEFELVIFTAFSESESLFLEGRLANCTMFGRGRGGV